ncbi:bifunctional glutamate/proline--tRNA ligase [Diprion similis]|uniref:bifunctional glutamate/proline--tRNA ligase n=1 Tax=Diprion similis TaxID=362088 RepID=UPI001EF78B28|nr:bifunctional glutamate/proline--tRNA ligase [Diprion similis]
MSFKLIASPHNPPLGALAITELLRSDGKIKVDVSWSEIKGPSNIQLFDEEGALIGENNNEAIRYLARTIDSALYGGEGALERTEVDHWLSFSIGPLKCSQSVEEALAYLERSLTPKTWLASKRFTIADISVFAALYSQSRWQESEKYPNITRWYKHVLSLPAVKTSVDTVNANATPAKDKPDTAGKMTKAPKGGGTRKEEGKFIELPGAEMGKVVVRFPPEASGYLHIGHAKAALLNQYYADNFQGQLIMRFDDTNPAKESVEFEEAILEDLKMLQIKPDRFTHTSQYFDLMLSYCQQMLTEGKAYVDDTPAAAMKEQRDQRLPSVNRDNSVEKNLELWEEMKKGSSRGTECCVRAKIDYESVNGCMRDPTIYRCKPEPHPRTGTKYKVYPTYDFACPIVDAIEGVTHTLRTTEYHDRDAQFYWLIEALNLRRPHIWAYSRLNMTHTVLSKRKLTWFVAEGLVDGWDDPRFPTVRGVLRRGMTVEGLKQFIIAQGSSKSVVFMEWDKIWSFNKKIIDPTAARYTALSQDQTIPVRVLDATEGWLTVQNHPKDPAQGTKRVRIGPNLLIEKDDAEVLIEGQNATFINWGNLLIQKVKKENGTVTEIEAKLNLDNKDFKSTLKLTWLCQDKSVAKDKVEESNLIPCYAVYFDHIISKAVLGKDDDFKDFVAKNTRKEVALLGEVELKRVVKGEIIQLQRKGFFRCDVPYASASPHSSREQPLILFHVPDGHATSPTTLPTASPTTSSTKAPAEASQSPKELNTVGNNGKDLSAKVAAQGEKVRELKAAKAEKKVIEQEVKTLLALKAEYKAATGADWKPGAAPVPAATKTTNSNRSAEIISSEILKQGDKVRQLKAEKAEKKLVEVEVKTLLNLKAEYKSATGEDWKPGVTPVAIATDKVQKEEKIAEGRSAEIICNEIAKQGDKVRVLKGEKADKKVVEAEVKTLLSLKAEYKSATGQYWKPGTVPVRKTDGEKKMDPGAEISVRIVKQGDKVRQLKSEKASKSVIDEEVKTLLALKVEYKTKAGNEWKPEAVPSAAVKVESKNDNAEKISNEIKKQGDKVRDLKAAKVDKKTVDQEVKVLLNLKAEYKTASGQDWKPSSSSTPARDAKKSDSQSKKPASVNKSAKEAATKDKEVTKTGTRLGLEAKKNESLSEWYSQVITKGEMIEYYDVSGCYVLRPWSYHIWEVIKEWFDGEIKKLGVQNCYFPIFVSRSVLEKEKAHIADFAPEVAWVTKSGDSELAEPIAIRPTSETVMYPAYAKWLKSHRDLPLKLNQWNNVVRWEFKHPQPFLRTREFLWQEGHTAFATKTEAEEEVLTILELYAKIYEDILAIPVVKGRKTEKEKFAGGDFTTTVEAFVSASGRAIQGATSHFLGQNFSKMFDIQVEGVEEGSEKIYVYQNSWGITTRTIGVMIMVHGDDNGLVLPPRVAAVQAVIIPCGITASSTPEQRQQLLTECTKLENQLKTEGKLRVQGDYRDNYSPGWKFNHWELKGVPLRIELGPKDLQKNQVTLVRRDNSARLTIPRAQANTEINKLLEEIQKSMFVRASEDMKQHIKQAEDWKDFCAHLDNKNIILSPFCGEISCEDKIKADSAREDAGEEPGAPAMGAKSLCIPFEQPTPPAPLETLRCINLGCKNKPKFYTLFGRSY